MCSIRLLEERKTCKSLFFPSTLWVVGIEFRLSSLAISTLSPLASYSCGKHHGQTKVRKYLINPTTYSPSWREVRVEIQGRNLEADSNADTTDGCRLLTCSSWLAQPAFLCNPGSIGPEMELLTVGWDFWQQLLIKKNAPKICLQVNLLSFLTWGFFFPDYSVLSWWKASPCIPLLTEPPSQPYLWYVLQMVHGCINTEMCW